MSGSPPVVRSGILCGWASIRLNEGDGMLASMRNALTSPVANLFRPYHLYLLADAQALLGMRADALGTLSDALAYVREVGEPWWEAEIHRLEGELLLAGEHEPPAAEACFVRAMETAEKQGARALELRAAISLADLWRRSRATVPHSRDSKRLSQPARRDQR